MCERLTYSGVELGQKKKAFDGELARIILLSRPPELKAEVIL